MHYESIVDLLDETLDYIGDKFDSYFTSAELDINEISTLPLEKLYLITPEYLAPWLGFIKENVKLFQTFLTRHETLKISSFYERIFKMVISPILTRFKVKEQDQEYMFLFYVEGIIGIVKKWIREGCARPIDEITSIINQVVQTYES